MPAVIVLLSLLLYREKVSFRQMAGVVLCILGAALIVLRGELKTLIAMSFVQGDLLMIIAVSGYALYSALLRRRPPIHPLSLLTATFFLGAAGLLPAWGAYNGFWHYFKLGAAAAVFDVAEGQREAEFFTDLAAGDGTLEAHFSGQRTDGRPVTPFFVEVEYLGPAAARPIDQRGK